MTLQDAIERGDVVEFRKLCADLKGMELLGLLARVGKQPALAEAVQKILRDRKIIKSIRVGGGDGLGT